MFEEASIMEQSKISRLKGRKTKVENMSQLRFKTYVIPTAFCPVYSPDVDKHEYAKSCNSSG